MTDHPTDTDIIAAHQAEYDDELDVTVCTCGDWTLNEDVIDYGAGVDEINRAKARQHAAHVADRLTAARTIETVADRLRAGADAADRADEALDLLNDTLPTGRILVGFDLDYLADRLRRRADELDPPDSEDPS